MGVGNLIASLDFMLRVALIPRGVINHDEDKPSCIQSERYPIRGGLAEKNRCTIEHGYLLRSGQQRYEQVKGHTDRFNNFVTVRFQ